MESMPDTPGSPSPGSLPTRGRKRAYAVLTFLLPFGLLLLLEAGLRLAGFGQSYPLFEPVPDAPEFLQANHDVVRRFMVREEDTPKLWIRPVPFQRAKAP
jgi:hypothetical protein